MCVVCLPFADNIKELSCQYLADILVICHYDYLAYTNTCAEVVIVPGESLFEPVRVLMHLIHSS